MVVEPRVSAVVFGHWQRKLSIGEQFWGCEISLELLQSWGSCFKLSTCTSKQNFMALGQILVVSIWGNLLQILEAFWSFGISSLGRFHLLHIAVIVTSLFQILMEDNFAYHIQIFACMASFGFCFFVGIWAFILGELGNCFGVFWSSYQVAGK